MATPTTGTTGTTSAPAKAQTVEKAQTVDAVVGMPTTQQTLTVELPEGMSADEARMILANVSTGANFTGAAQTVATYAAASQANSAEAESAKKALEGHRQRMRDLGVEDGMPALTADMAAREIRVRDKLTAAALQMDEIPGGGKSMVDGTEVWNITGTPVKSGESMPRELFAGVQFTTGE